MPDRTQRIRLDDPLKRAIEYRSFAVHALRAVDATAAVADAGFDGYASTFWNVDSYGTAFAPGCFLRTLNDRSDKVLVLWQHDAWSPIGKPTAMKEDERGLSVSARITPGTEYGDTAMALLRDDVPLGLSVGFKTMRERPATPDDPLILDGSPEWVRRDPTTAYVIEEVKLYEFSIVSFPANDMVEIAAVRADAQAEALAMALADLKAGRLAESHRAVLTDLVAAWQAAPDAVRSAPRADSKAPRTADRWSELTVLAAQYGLPLELSA